MAKRESAGGTGLVGVLIGAAIVAGLGWFVFTQTDMLDGLGGPQTMKVDVNVPGAGDAK